MNPLKIFWWHYFKGISLEKKIVVIESDDWGGIRMSGKQQRDNLAKEGIDVLSNPFNRYDCLENSQDFEALYEVLQSTYQKFGIKPLITCNTIMANPDFEKIKNSGYKDYHFKYFHDTYADYGDSTALSLFFEGIKNEFLKPQFHGREHLNVLIWLRSLQNGHKELLKAFDKKVFGIELNERVGKRSNIMAAWDIEDQEDQLFINHSITEGLKFFEQFFGFSSNSVIAPAAVWNDSDEYVLNKSGVQYIQSFIHQTEKNSSGPKYGRNWIYQGQKNGIGLMYIQRNSYFEPSTIQTIDWVDKCLNQIKRAFIFKKPAVISMHRVNFSGGIEEINRTQSLEKFKVLLEKIILAYPEVIFMSSDQLGDYIKNVKCAG